MQKMRQAVIHFHKLLLISFLVLFGVVLSLLAKNYPTLPADVSITSTLQQDRFHFLSALLIPLSRLGDFPYDVYTAIALVVFLAVRRLPLAASFVALTFISYPINSLIKLLIHRPRPVDDTLIIVFQERSGYSFPSGHVTHFVVFYGFFLFLLLHSKFLPKLWRKLLILLCIVLIVAIGPSRIFLGVHWFSDVVGGYILGSLILLALIAFYHKLVERSPSQGQ